jgi:hypothetical protein
MWTTAGQRRNSERRQSLRKRSKTKITSEPPSTLLSKPVALNHSVDASTGNEGDSRPNRSRNYYCERESN